MEFFPAIARRGFALALTMPTAMLNMSPAQAAKPAEVLDKPIAATLTAIPIDFDRDNPDRKKFGKLIFLSGLNLFAKSRHFGGYSGLVLDASGTSLLAVSDAGTWLRAGLDYDGRKLKGLSKAVIGPILGKDGKPLRRVSERDAEALALTSGDLRQGTALVAFERQHRIMRYPFTLKSFGPPVGSVPLPPQTKKMSSNRGIEAIAQIDTGPLKGTLVAFAEGLTDTKGNLQGWLIGGPRSGPITLKRIGGFDITDAAPLPDGGIVVLERRFRYSEGVKMRVRRIAARELKSGALIAGEVLLEAHDNLNIDNMEAIAAHRSRSGETVLTLMSDDNFNPFQRTLIMQFALPGAQSAAAD
ncbi:MAG: esterase-like activity of phytase family protein [Methyloceanibacter sp.]